MTYLRTKLSWRILAGAALGLLAIPMLGGCPGSLDLQPFTHASSSSAGGSGSVSVTTGATGSGGSPCDAVAQIITPTCATTGCHSGGRAVAQANLDLTESSLPGLVGMPASECGGGLIIDPTTPANSVLYIKVTAGGACPSRMPFGGPYLSDADQQCLLTWIESEASMGTSSSTAAASSTAATTSTASSSTAASSSSAGTGGASSSAGGAGGASSAGAGGASSAGGAGGA